MLRLLLFTAFALGSLTATPAVAEPRTVEVGLFLIDVAAIDQRAETFTAELDVIARWQDPTRAFTPSEGEELPRLFVGESASAYLGTGWSPELHALNAIDVSDPGRLRVLVQPDGTVTLRASLRRTLRAQLDFRAFPFDTQVLPIIVESVLHDSDEVRLHNESSFTGFDSFFEIPEWAVTDLISTTQIRERVQEQQTYDRLTFFVHINRHDGYYIWKIMLPMVVIVMLSWIVFWMSDEMLGRRAGVSSTGMLTIIAYQFVVADALPRFPYQTVMDRFVLASLLTVAATMVVNLVGSRLAVERRQRLDRVCSVVFPVVYVVVVVFLLAGKRGGA